MCQTHTFHHLCGHAFPPVPLTIIQCSDSIHRLLTTPTGHNQSHVLCPDTDARTEVMPTLCATCNEVGAISEWLERKPEARFEMVRAWNEETRRENAAKQGSGLVAAEEEEDHAPSLTTDNGSESSNEADAEATAETTDRISTCTMPVNLAAEASGKANDAQDEYISPIAPIASAPPSSTRWEPDNHKDRQTNLPQSKPKQHAASSHDAGRKQSQKLKDLQSRIKALRIRAEAALRRP